MSKIDSALHEIQSLDRVAREKKWINEIHPLPKLLITIFYIWNVVSFDKYDFMGLLGMILYPVILFVVGEISFREGLYRVRFVLPLVCVVGIFNPLFDREIVATIGTLEISGGVLSMISLMWKGVLTVFASYLLIATTTMEKICYALQLFHLPKTFVLQILLIYRYITVLLKEARRMAAAYRLRAPGQKGIAFSAWGSFVGQLLLRSMDRADHVYQSMLLRGFDGNFQYFTKKKATTGDYFYTILMIVLILMLRFVPIFEVVGGLFL